MRWSWSWRCAPGRAGDGSPARPDRSTADRTTPLPAALEVLVELFRITDEVHLLVPRPGEVVDHVLHLAGGEPSVLVTLLLQPLDHFVVALPVALAHQALDVGNLVVLLHRLTGRVVNLHQPLLPV